MTKEYFVKKNNIAKIIGAFVFIFGIFFLMLSITNIFNDIDFIDQYNNCIEVSKYEPTVLGICKNNVSEGLGISIRSNQVELATAQYLKVYIKEIIGVLFAVLMIIIGNYLYDYSNKRETSSEHHSQEVKKTAPITTFKNAVKKKPIKKKK